MAAPVKSCYNTRTGEFLFEDAHVFSGKEREAFIKCCEPLSVMRVCVNAVAADSLFAELVAFTRELYNYKVYGNENVQENNKGAGKAVMPRLGFCLDSIVKDVESKIVKENPEYRHLERVLYEQFELNKDGVLSPKPGKDISPDSLKNQNDPDAPSGRNMLLRFVVKASILPKSSESMKHWLMRTATK